MDCLNVDLIAITPERYTIEPISIQKSKAINLYRQELHKL